MTDLRPPLRERELRWLTLAMGATLIPIITTLPYWVPFLGALFAVWRLLPGWLGRQRAPLAFLRLPLGLLCFGGIYLEFGNLNGIEPGTALLVLMLGLKLLETWKPRDGLVLVLLAYILMLAVFLGNQSLLAALWLSAICCFQTAILLRLTRLGEPGPLRPSLVTAGKLLLQALPIAIILFVLFPRVPGPLWGTPTPEPRATTGLSDRMSPGSISQLAQSNALAFRVSFPEHEAPESGQRYWRGPVFHAFDGQEWREGRMPDREATLLPLGEGVTQEITLEAHGQDWLIALDMPGGELPNDSQLRADMRLQADEPVSERLRYQIQSWPNYALDPELPEGWQERLTRLPDDSNPQTRELAREWLAEVDGDPHALVDRAMSHFNEESFYYTLEPPTLGRHGMDDFLFDSQRGFCEHYAAAFTVLMRAADIPSRVVTGYVGGEYNPMAGHFRVLQSNAHAWSEIWLPEEGWVRVDPTTAIDPSRVETQAGGMASGTEGEDWEGGFNWENLGLQLEMIWDTIQARWDGWFLAYGPEQQRDFLERLGLPGKDAMRLALIMVGLVTIFALLLWLILSLKQRPPRPRDPVERSWQRFEGRMRRAGLARQPQEGPAAWLQRLEREVPGVAEQLRPLINRFRSARYAGTSPQGKQLEQALSAWPARRLKRLARLDRSRH
ncbi:transglutaminase-like putative cysteine protease [Natronospira proteinivora]|uniref:Transglutaminase-like putative cysteine protease n=1 Tax=Natronospira proteinivora TaxID=1807133 RepID=A0ABT1G4G6_9GAMM|nr:DUF3488 and transglutaminase-like domain-containing protein [Natronospira proteinivora]MCP1726180.1 transglutaminase-like putative cysteine protease [Natronospira proteinivora]